MLCDDYYVNLLGFGQDDISGESTYVADFSGLTEKGVYRIEAEGVKSFSFEIADNVFDKLKQHRKDDILKNSINIQDIFKIRLLKKYLDTWRDKSDKLGIRQKALLEACKNIHKRLLINSADLYSAVSQNNSNILAFNELGNDLRNINATTEKSSKEKLVMNLYKMYYHKVLKAFLDKLGNQLKDMVNNQKYLFFKKLSYIALVSKVDKYNKQKVGEISPIATKLKFKAHSSKTGQSTENKNIMLLLLPKLLNLVKKLFNKQKQLQFFHIHKR